PLTEPPPTEPPPTDQPPADQAPTIDSIGAQSVQVGLSVIVAFSASDPDGDPLNVTVSSDSAAASAVQSDPPELTVSGAAEGAANITVTVDDGRGASSSTTFVVAVLPAPPPPATNQPPTIGSIDAQSVEVGQSVDVAVSASDPDGDTLAISASSD